MITRHPLLRRWDHPAPREDAPDDGAVAIVEGRRPLVRGDGEPEDLGLTFTPLTART